MKKNNRADKLDISFKVKGKILQVDYTIDDSVNGNISINFHFSIEKYPPLFHAYLASSCAVVISSLILAKKINFNFCLPQRKLFLEAMELVYNIRSYSEFGAFVSLPKVISPKCKKEEKIAFSPKEKESILFWSGGVDSTLSYLLLKKNGYKVRLIHTNINQDQSTSEKIAVSALSKILRVNPDFVSIKFPGLKTIGKQYSKKFAKFPSYNSIPFGRDIIHASVGLYFCYKHDSKYLCFGHEYELWRNYIKKNNKQICRNDFQSELGCLLLDKICKKMSKELSIFSPIAALSKLRIYQTLFDHSPRILANTTSCYFGSGCGACNNCLLHKNLGRVMRREQGDIEKMKEWLSAKNTTEEETFAKTLYLYFYDAAQQSKDTRKLKNLLQIKFGNLLKNSRSSVRKDLQKVHQNKLAPKGFEYELDK
jgi:7-cyano-7-deazaguanine synthase in queuosine biosynthesis